MSKKLAELQTKCQQILDNPELASPAHLRNDDSLVWDINRLVLATIATEPHLAGAAMELVSRVIPHLPASDVTNMWIHAQSHNHKVAYKIIEQTAAIDDSSSENRWLGLITGIQPDAPKGLLAKVVQKAMEVGMDREIILEKSIDLLSDDYVVLGQAEILEQFEEMAKIFPLDHPSYSRNAVQMFVDYLIFIDQHADKKNYHDIKERATLALGTITGHGVDIEGKGEKCNDDGISMISCLHVACWEMEHRDPQPIGITIDVLLDCGADWEKVKAHRHGPKGVAWARMQRHPAVRKAILGEIADKTRHEQVNKKLRI